MCGSPQIFGLLLKYMKPTRPASDRLMAIGAVAEVSAQLKQLAQAHRWAFADLDLPFATMLAGTGPYAAGAHLTCTMPYGWYFSLDGLRPTAEGQRLIANAVALAINDAYRLGLPTLGVSTLLPLRASPCP